MYPKEGVKVNGNRGGGSKTFKAYIKFPSPVNVNI